MSPALSVSSKEALIAIPYAQPYDFPEGNRPDLAEYLAERSEYDPECGCLDWTGSIDEGHGPQAYGQTAKKYRTRQATRLAWLAHHGKPPPKGSALVRRCGNPKCINPHHIEQATPNDQWHDPDLPRIRQGSIGVLMLGKHFVPAQEVYHIQSYQMPRDPSLGLRWVFRWQLGCAARYGTPLSYYGRAKLNRIRAIRRCPIKATRTVMPCGFVRYDLPQGITEIEFTEPPPPTYEDVFG